MILDAIANLDPDLSINIDELERKTSDSVDAPNTKSWSPGPWYPGVRLSLSGTSQSVVGTFI